MITCKEGIIELWKRVGINNIEDYSRILSNRELFDQTETILGDVFDPDVIDPKLFWEASDEHFGMDPVCNSVSNGINKGKTLNVISANEANNNLAVCLNSLGYINLAKLNLKRRNEPLAIAEIGCGHGSFYEHFVKNENIDYVGFDVVARFPEAVELKGRGCFSVEQIAEYSNRFNVFYCFNVFQHLSLTQIETYLEQISTMIKLGGWFIFSYMEAPWSFHYGQKIEICNSNYLFSILYKHGFNMISYTIQCANSMKPTSYMVQKINVGK